MTVEYIERLSPTLESVNRVDEQEVWLTLLGIEYTVSELVYNPENFEPRRKWFFTTEEDKTLFLLKWNGTAE